MRKFAAFLTSVAFIAMFGLFGSYSATPTMAAASNGCMIPRGGDADNNGIGDVGVQVVCNYSSYYAEDASGAYYWDLGDGRIYTSPGVTSPADLDATTLDECFYRVHTRGSFNNDPYQDTGEINNMIRCSGVSGTSTYYYQIVSQDDPRYTGNPDFAEWGTWEYHVLAQSGQGNMVHRLVGPTDF